MSEKLNQPEEQNENVETSFEQTMQDVPTFDERRKRNQAERLQRVLELAKITEVRKDDETFDEAIQSLDGSQSFNLLNHINGVLRGATRSERGRRRHVMVGDYRAPNSKIQMDTLDITTEALKNIKDNHYRATLSYYMINALHLFGDGNGRTSRAVYEIFDDPNFDLSDKRVIHNEIGIHSDGGVDQADFEREKGIHSTKDALREAGNFVKRRAFESGRIDNSVNGVDMTVDATFGDIYFTPDAEKNLSSREKRAVVYALQYNQQIGALALCDILTKKGTLKDIVYGNKKDSKPQRFIFKVEAKDDREGKNDEARKIFDDWTADDYRHFVRLAAGAHRTQLKTLVEIFRTPDQYAFDDGSKAADWLCESR